MLQEAANRNSSAEQAAEGTQGEGQQGGTDNPPPVDANPESPMDVDQPGNTRGQFSRANARDCLHALASEL
jgi:hypothetical protein